MVYICRNLLYGCWQTCTEVRCSEFLDLNQDTVSHCVGKLARFWVIQQGEQSEWSPHNADKYGTCNLFTISRSPIQSLQQLIDVHRTKRPRKMDRREYGLQHFVWQEWVQQNISLHKDKRTTHLVTDFSRTTGLPTTVKLIQIKIIHYLAAQRHQPIRPYKESGAYTSDINVCISNHRQENKRGKSNFEKQTGPKR